MNQLILGLGTGFPISLAEEMELLAEIGWDGFFSGWQTGEDLEGYAKKAQALGLYYQSVHAPFHHVDLMWEEGEEGDLYTENLIRCLGESHGAGVDLVILHAIKGMDKCTPNALGLGRFQRVFTAAEQLGVTVALENTEGEIYLETLMTEFGSSDKVRFCIDTGHEMCYNGSKDMIGKYAHKLVCTHLNDNMGQTGDAITWLDDSHLMPFDGIADWKHIAARLKAADYKGDLTFELTRKNRPGKNTHDRYAHLDCRGFDLLAFEKAKQFKELMTK